ncbi:MAG: hypothetical protein PHG64_14430 [Paludibacter sp.]|nr:hypothetical protein [Paludibacter sp.]
MSNRKIYRKLPDNYYNYFDICKWEGIPVGTAKSGAARGIDGISAVEALKPIAHQFKVFPKYENGTLRNQYGILKTNYDFYKAKGRARKQSPGKTPKWKNDDNFTNINIPIDKKLYEEFKEVVDNANAASIVKVLYRDMIAVAIREFVDRRPQFQSKDSK